MCCIREVLDAGHHRRVHHLVQHQDVLHQTTHLRVPTVADLQQQNVADVANPLSHGRSRDKTAQQLARANQQLQVHGLHQLQQVDRYENSLPRRQNLQCDQYVRTPKRHFLIPVALNDVQDFRQTRCAQGGLGTFRQGQMMSIHES